MILAIDVGIKNLSLCVMNYQNPNDLTTYSIELWGVYDTLNTPDELCKSLKKSGDICGKKCNYKHENAYSCKTHFPKSSLPIKPCNKFSQKKVKSYSFQDLAKNVISKITEIYTENAEIFANITKVFIELQPNCNQRMKFISHIIYGKFIDLYKEAKVDINFIRASKKLSLSKLQLPVIQCSLKSKYSRRKFLSIEYVKFLLENKFSEEQKEKWLPFLLSHKKQDDFSDTYLYCVNVIINLSRTKK